MSAGAGKLEEARRKLPLRDLMTQFGKGPNDRGKFSECPFCHHKDSAGFFKGKKDGELFKCHHTSCPTANAAMDQIGFLAFQRGISNEDAFREFLTLTGLWTERAPRSPSLLPGKQARKNAPPKKDASVESNCAACGKTFVTPEHEANGEVACPHCGEKNFVGRAVVIDAPAFGSMSIEFPARPPETAGQRPALPPNNLPAAELSAPLSSGVDEPSEEPPKTNLDLRKSLNSGLSQGSDDGAAGVHGSNEPTIDSSPDPKGPGESTFSDGKKNEKEKSGDSPDLTDGSSVLPPSLRALRYFYERCSFTEEHQRQCWAKRGLTPESCEAMGLVSGQASNKVILDGMLEVFPLDVLEDAGLFGKYKYGTNGPQEFDPDAPIVPSRFFHGYGISGIKPKEDRRNEDDKFLYGWCQPILIPYFDEAGELVKLRPHKGGIAGDSVRLFIALTGRKWREKKSVGDRPHPGPLPQERETDAPLPLQEVFETVSITEGEFKAMAVWQATAGKIGSAALPGISTGKPLFPDIEDWVADIAAKRAAVVFDNEDKSDPKLPGYKEDEWERYDPEAWARWLAGQLSKCGVDARVGKLPDEWRDKNGKADLDGALAFLIRDKWNKKERPPPSPRPSPSGEGGLPNAEKVWKAVAAAVRADFLKVLESCVPVHRLWQSEMYPSKAERHIQNKLKKISFEPQLGTGGEKEVAMARRLQRFVRKSKGDKRLEDRHRFFLTSLARLYLELPGSYYILKSLTEKKQETWDLYEAKARRASDTEFLRVIEIAKKGIPKTISNFQLKCRYTLRKVNGGLIRLVELRNNLHETTAKRGLLDLPSAFFSQPVTFRTWVLDQGGFAWGGGQDQLTLLHIDVAHHTAGKDVSEVAVRGWHEESKLYFFQDCAITPDGHDILPDRNGIIWHEGFGYKFKQVGQVFVDQEGQKMPAGPGSALELPRMHPSREIEEAPLQVMFQNIATKLFETFGNYEAWLAMGIVLAAGAANEIYSRYVGFPGLWVHGEMGQGKSSVVRWLIRLWGITSEKGMPIAGSTLPGLSIAMQQYSNLPQWLEEFQPEADKKIIERLKNFYGRETGNKKTFGDEMPRQVLATCIVSGVATSSDPQLFSRYAHVQVAAKRRMAEHFDWFEQNSRDFFFVGRHILRNRKEFSRMTMGVLDGWMNSPVTKGMDERVRTVHGAAYAAMATMGTLLQSHSAEQMNSFKEFLLNHARGAVKEVRAQVNVNQFWTDVLAALKDDAFGETPSERRRIFKVQVKEVGFHHKAPHQNRLAWNSVKLYFQPEPVINMLRAYKKRSGRDVPLDRGDLLKQMQTRPYWVPGPKGEMHKQRFEGGKSAASCWGIDLDEHDLGFVPVGEEEYESSFVRDGESLPGDYKMLTAKEWVDPRQGDLFELVHSLARAVDEEKKKED